MKSDYFFVYETTNLINGMKYRGIHKTKKISDNYLGSGMVLVNAIQKYGKENFKKEILEFCESYEELIEREKFYVDEDWVKDRTNYNAKTGGQSAGILSDESKKKISNTLKEKYKSGEIVATIGEWIKENGNYWTKDVVKTKEFKEACSKAGKKRFEDDKENHPFILFGNRIVTEETKQKISKTLKEKFKNGERIPVHNIKSDEEKKRTSETLKLRYKTQEHHSKGKPSWNKGKIMEKIECPHCKRMIDKLNAKKWHFDNCKMKNQAF